MGKLQVFGATAAIIGVALLGACNKPAPAAGGLTEDQKTAIAALKADETQWVADLKAKELEKVVQHYANDGNLLAPGQLPTHGQGALRVAFRQMFDDPAFALSFKPDKVWIAASGDLGYTRGAYEMTGTDPKTHKVGTDKGSYVTVYRKTANGSWRAIEDIATPSVATSPATPVEGGGAPPKSAPNPTADEAAVRAADAAFLADWKTKDAAKIAAHYTADATSMVPGGPAASGTAAITAGLTEALKDPAWKLEFSPDAVVVAPSGDLAYTRGMYTLTSTDPKTHKAGTMKGSYVTIWLKQADGSWKAVEDIAASGYPAT